MTVIPGYTIDRRIGSGGGGEVYRGFREGSDRPLALKVIRAAPARPGEEDAATRRAWRELDLTSQLRLPAIPRVIDYGHAGAQLFVATEYIDGLPLHHYAQTQRLDRRARAALLARVADAVQSIHERGVIHRDLKPSNILVDHAGEPSIIDLGVAVLAEVRPDITMTADGAPIGTPAFMAPEQARGDRAAVSTRTDVYGLGATAYALLTGRCPHDDPATPSTTDSASAVTTQSSTQSLYQIIHRVGHDPPADPRLFDPSLPRGLAAVLLKAVSPDPARRYASAAEFAADLRRWLGGEAVEARAAGLWTRAARWTARHPAITTTAVCAIVVLLTIAGMAAGIWWFFNTTPSRGYVTTHEPWEVQVITSSGRVVASWPSSPEANAQHGPALARRIIRPAPFNDTVFATLANSDRDAPWDLKLCVWRSGDFAEPLWSAPSALEPVVTPPYPDVDGLPDRIKPKQPGQYLAKRAEIADVFPETPGDEIILGMTCDEHPSPIRVYSLDGRVLCEFWHMGSVGDVHWLPGPRLIVVSASHGRRKWPDQGFDADADRFWPAAVFAVQPKLGQRSGWICDGDSYDHSIDLRWYKFVAHPSVEGTRDLIELDVGASACTLPSDKDRRAAAFDVVLTSKTLGGFGRMSITSDGQVFDRVLSDNGKTTPLEALFDQVHLTDRLPTAK